MLIFRRYYLCLSVLVPLVFFSCKKNIDQLPEAVSDGPISMYDVPAYWFDWEAGNYMPTPPGTVPIFIPWVQGASKGFTSDIWSDIKKTDGWELVYNRFNPNEPLSTNPFFILYNKYRGLLRIYVYVTTSGFTNSDYLTDGLNLGPNAINSSMLNFISQDIIDFNSNKTVATQIQGTQISTGVWYASQYEIAYDPNVANATYQQLGMNYTLKWTNISIVDLQGTVQGTLKGTITTPASGFNLGNTLMNGALQALGLTVFNNNKGPDANHPGTGNTLGLPAFVFEAAKNGLSSGLSGVVQNVFNGIFGGNSNNSQQVSLTLNAKIKLTGSITGSGALIPDPGLGLGVPGTSNSQIAPGLIPYYNLPMGVFNINHKPLAYWHMNEFSDGTIEGTSYQYYLWLENNSFDPIFNPAVLASAQIQNYTEELFFYNIGGWADYTAPAEQVGNLPIFWGSLNLPFGAGGGPFIGDACVRVSFDVVPNNGAPRSKIVKTFACDLQQQ
jgi:hypothetical protein